MIEFLQQAVNGANTSGPYTFSSQNFGSAEADRVIIALCVTQGSSNQAHQITDVTIGGVTATLYGSESNQAGYSCIAVASVPTGTSGDVVVTHTGTTARAGVALYKATELASSVPNDTAFSTSDPVSGTLDIPANGFGIGISFNGDDNDGTWTGLDQDFLSQVESSAYFTGATRNFAESETDFSVSFDWGSSHASQNGSFASFGFASNYEISGVATLNDEPVENATIRCIKQSDNTIIPVQTTNSSGEYTIPSLESGELYHVMIEYEVDDDKYNALSYWDISPVEAE